MLSSSQIVKFFDHQYLWKGSDNVLDFLPGDRQQWMEIVLTVGFGQAYPARRKHA